MPPEFDFIVIGAGASGSVVASRLARATQKPSVLLLEAGSSDDRATQRLEANDPNPTVPAQSWGFRTVPQSQLAGQEINYERGRGIGGSTAINFGVWTVGSQEDYNSWARHVGDNAFSWENVKRILRRKVERHHLDVPEEFKDLIKPRNEDHGVDGKVGLSYQSQWQRSVREVFQTVEKCGFKANIDVNSGNPTGMGMCSLTICDGWRTSASTAYLQDVPENLTVLSDAHVARILFESRVARGVRTADGREFLARKEVILSAGALQTPQILLLSGVGPTEELQKLGIEALHALPQVGKNLQDHCTSCVGVIVKNDDSSAFTQRPPPMGWFKIPGLEDDQVFKLVPEETQKFLQESTVPHWEFISHSGTNIDPSRFVGEEALQPGERLFGCNVYATSPQSRGSVTLRSSKPLDAPLFDPRFLSHPLDKHIQIAAMRQTMRFIDCSGFSERVVRKVSWPLNDSDEEIWNHIKNTAGSCWHMSGTAAMTGSRDPTTGCVDSDFNVLGLERLRVVDLSVAPNVSSAHTQCQAYIVGEIAAEKLMSRYNLD